jgi:hypothetical protein
MPGDYSRRTFDPNRDVAGVYEQQGRVRLDANLNELVDLLDRRLRATSRDTLGPAVVPVQTPDGFLLALGAGTLTIGPGRAYADGIVVDNHGRSLDGLQTPAFDPTLEELRGTGVIPWLRQPYLPAATSSWATAEPKTGVYVAYLDVWHRERTWVEEPALLDPALFGIDTATRRQTVWQVKLLSAAQAAGPVTCTTTVAGWDDVVRPSAARLTTAAVGVPAVTDPCQIPPNGGYRGVENRLYRVEVHDGGGFGTATWKWSRDNAAVASPVTAMGGAELTVERLGRDNVLRFATGDWIEITDDDREEIGQPGELAQVLKVDETRDVVVLSAPPATPFNTAAPTTVATRIRRWDQIGAGPTGLLALTNAAVVLEDGVQVTFTLDPAIAGGTFRTGEYWVFAARVADSSVEALAAAPPVAPHHHIARLAVVDFDAATVTDCRVMWPPPSGSDGGCECDFCVTADSHNSGAFTIQEAVKQAGAAGVGGVVCLGPGVYRLRQSVSINAASSLTIRGKGWRTIVLTPGDRPAFVVSGSRETTIEDLMVLGSTGRVPEPTKEIGTGSLLTSLGGRCAVAVLNSLLTTISRCTLVTAPFPRTDRMPTLATLGLVVGLTVNDCAIVGTVAIGNPLASAVVGKSTARRNVTKVPLAANFQDSDVNLDARQSYLAGRLLAIRWAVKDNLLFGTMAGVAVMGPVVAAFDNRFSRNDVVAGEIGLVMTGMGLDATTVMEQNVVLADGIGIAVGIDGARVEDNIVIGSGASTTAALVLVVKTLMAAAQGDATASTRRRASTGTARTALTPPAAAADRLWPEIVQADNPVVNSKLSSPALADIPAGLLARAGILVVDGLGLRARLTHVRVTGNEVQNIAGFGILAAASVERLLIEANRVKTVAIAGIVVIARNGGVVVVAANTVDDVGTPTNRTRDPAVPITPEGPCITTRIDLIYRPITAVHPAIGLGAIAVAGPDEAHVRDNQVDGVLPDGHGRAFGIHVDAVAIVRVSGNRVGDVGTSGSSAFAIAVLSPFTRADVFDNDVDSVDLGEGTRWIGILIGRAVRAVPGFSTFGAGLFSMYAVAYEDKGQSMVALIGHLLSVYQLPSAMAAARGNAVVGGGTGPLVEVSVNGVAQLSDNRVLSDGSTQQGLVAVEADKVIFDANSVELAIRRPAVELLVDPGQVTVLGNVVLGRILVQGVDLAAPWDPLNVFG